MASLFWAEFECTVHVALPKRSINQLKPVHQSRHQVLRSYCPNIYILCRRRTHKEQPPLLWPLGLRSDKLKSCKVWVQVEFFFQGIFETKWPICNHPKSKTESVFLLTREHFQFSHSIVANVTIDTSHSWQLWWTVIRPT